jgi:hypothetical protein
VCFETLGRNGVCSTDLAHALTVSERWRALRRFREILEQDLKQSTHQQCREREVDVLLVWNVQLALQTSDPTLLPDLLECLRSLWAHPPQRHQHHNHHHHARYTQPDPELESLSRFRNKVAPVADANGTTIQTLLTCWRTYRYDTVVLESLVPCFRALAKQGRFSSTAPSSGVGQWKEVAERLHAALARETRPENALRPTLWGLLKDAVFRALPDEKCGWFGTFQELTLRELLPKDTTTNTDIGMDSSNSVSNVTMEHGVGILWSWAVIPRLGRTLAESTSLWIILDMLHNDRSPRSRILATRQKATATLGTILTHFSSTNDVNDENPVPETMTKQTWIASRLLTLLETESDPDWRRRCLRTLRCLCSCSWGRRMLDNACTHLLLPTLLRIVRDDTADSPDTRVQACQCLSTMLPLPPPSWIDSLPLVETTLIQTASKKSTPDKVVLAASQALAASLQYSPWKRSASCFSTSFHERVRDVLQDNEARETYHVAFGELLHQIVLEHEHQTSVPDLLSSTTILDIITLLLTPLGPDFGPSRDHALRVVEILSRHEKKKLADHESLLGALVNLCLVTSGELKVQVKTIVLDLVPEL